MEFAKLIQRDGIPFPMVKTDSHPCPYIEGNVASELMILSQHMDGEIYQDLMDRGFRRSENYFYRPDCQGCSECKSIRVNVDEFTPSKSQRRCQRKNSDIRYEINPPTLDEERFYMYELYQSYKHDGAMSCSREHYEELFCFSPINSLEMSYWLENTLVGIGIIDICSNSLSSVYFYFHPEYAERSLGVFSSLCEIKECQNRGLSFWYLGYYVDGCQKMDYKKNFKPNQLLENFRDWEPGVS